MSSAKERVKQAADKYRRHLFVDRFRDTGSDHWLYLTEKNLEKYYSLIYRDAPLVIWGATEDFARGKSEVSTISQPSFVLYLLYKLGIEPGDHVYELGTGSGWNTAMMAELARPGFVYTYEIIQPLAEQAERRLARLGIKNVYVNRGVKNGDGMAVPAGISFRRAIFTAGADDLPRVLHSAVAVGGRLIFVLERQTQSDLLLVLDQTAEGFVSSEILACEFVSVTGPSVAPVECERELEALECKDLSVRIVPSEWAVDFPSGKTITRRKNSTFIWSM